MNNSQNSGASIENQRQQAGCSPQELEPIIFEGRVLYRGGHVEFTSAVKVQRTSQRVGPLTRQRHNRRERERLSILNGTPYEETVLPPRPTPVKPQAELRMPQWVIDLGFEEFVLASWHRSEFGEWPNGIKPSHPSMCRLPIWQAKWLTKQRSREAFLRWQNEHRQKRHVDELVREIEALGVDSPLPIVITPEAELLLSQVNQCEGATR